MKTINVAAGLYYQQRKNFAATSSFDTFIGSWAGKPWIQRHRSEIVELYTTNKCRFGHWHNYILGIPE